MLTRRQLLELGAIGGAGSRGGSPAFAIGRTTRRGGRDAEAAEVAWRPCRVPPVLDGRGGGKSFKIAARESTTWKFHPDLPATRTWGYWSDSPQAGLAISRADDRGDQTARRHRRYVGDDRVEQRARQRVPAERSDAHGRRDAGRAGADRHRTCTAARTIHSSTARRCSGSRRAARKARTTSPTRYTYYNEQRAAWSGTTTTRSATRARTSTPGSRGLLHPRRPGHGRGRQSARAAGRPVRDPARAAGQDVQRRRQPVLPDRRA